MGGLSHRALMTLIVMIAAISFVLVSFFLSASPVAPALPSSSLQTAGPDTSNRASAARARKARPRSTSVRPPVLEVMVVDEHMHVLPHWFKLGTKDAPLGATLVHIDGHSDLGEPSDPAKWPRSNQARELLRAACENDEFIWYSLLLGQVSNIVFVAPSWTHLPDAMEVQQFSIGATAGQRPCHCMRGTCFVRGEELPPSQCRIVRKGKIVTVGERHVMQHGMPLLELGGPVILDVDLDFFGCDAPFVTLMDRGTSKWTLEALQKSLHHSVGLCAARADGSGVDADAEARAHRLLMLLAKSLGEGHGTAEELEAVLDAQPEMLARVYQDTRSCHTQQPAPPELELKRRLVAAFSTVYAASSSRKEFQHLADYGFCIDTEEFPRRTCKIGVCIGSSDYDDETNGRIEIHHPDDDDIKSAKLTMGKLIASLKGTNLTSVTVCRSLRDGYTPREYWKELERSVLRNVKQLTRTAKVLYDRDLMFGANGFKYERS